MEERWATINWSMALAKSSSSVTTSYLYSLIVRVLTPEPEATREPLGHGSTYLGPSLTLCLTHRRHLPRLP